MIGKKYFVDKDFMRRLGAKEVLELSSGKPTTAPQVLEPAEAGGLEEEEEADYGTGGARAS